MVTSDIRDEWWRQVSDVVYDVTPVDAGPRQGLQGSVWSRPLGQLIVGSTTFNSQYAHRNWQMIRRDGLDLYMVQAALAGEYAADFGHVNTRIFPGDIFFLDFAQPISSLKDAGARVSIVLPRAKLSALLQRHNLHGAVLRSSRPSTRLLFQYMVGINSYMEGVSEAEALFMQQSFVSLVSAAIETFDEHAARRLSMSLTLRMRVGEFIDQNLLNPALGPELIAQECGVSRAHLYRSFGQDGGVAKLIRDRRLNVAHQELTRKNGTKRSITEIVYACGFSDPSVFLRNFKARFGMTPSQVRKIGAPSREVSADVLSLHNHLAALYSRTSRVCSEP